MKGHINQRRVLTGVASLLCMFSAGFVFAQNEATAEEDERIEELVITASRVTTRPGYEAPSPTTVLNLEALQFASAVNVADTINALPSTGRPTSPRTTGAGVGGGTQGANFIDLRNIGTSRTLVLLDGRRFVPSQGNGQADLNLMPQNLIRKIDIVSGGASAAWGSDAVAGVVNLVLDTEYSGLKASLQGGTSEYSDAEETQFSIAGGTSFAEGRGHLLGSFGYTDSGDAGEVGDRDWYRAWKMVANTDPTGPSRLVLPNVAYNRTFDGGNITSGPMSGYAFLPNGSVTQIDYGTQYGQLSVGGTAAALENDQSTYLDVTAAYQTTTAFARASYDLTDNLNLYAEFSTGYSESSSHSTAYRLEGGSVIRVQPDNAFFLETGLDPAVFNNPSAPELFRLGTTNRQLDNTNPFNEREIMRWVVGADMAFDNGWTGSAYYQTGDSRILNETRNNTIRANYAQAVDAVYANGVSGNIVCRDTSNGCAPLNPFGEGNMSDAAIAFVQGTDTKTTNITQDVFSVSFSGDAFDLPAGPVSVAFGGEYREESLIADAPYDDGSGTSVFWLGNYRSTPKGGFDVTEFFAEAIVPVFRDSALGQSLDLNAAIRSTDYSLSGRVSTWKIGGTYDVGAGVRFRATVSRDIRAPSLSELYNGGSSTVQSAQNPFANNQTQAFDRLSSGNVFLTPEEAETTTFGIIYQPEFLDGFTISADYFEIDLADAIGNVSNQDKLDGCFAGDQNFCKLITFTDVAGVSTITKMLNAPVNFQKERYSAVDVEASYSFDAFGGQVSLRSMVTKVNDAYVIGFDSDPTDAIPGTKIDSLNEAVREYRWYNTARFRKDDRAVSLRHRYRGGGVYDNDYVSGVDIDDNSLDSISYFDLTATKDLMWGDTSMEVFGTIENLFDRDPNVEASTSRNGLGVSNNDDLIGRYFRIGVRAEF